MERREFLRNGGVVAVTVAVPPWVMGCSASAIPKEPDVPDTPDTPDTPGVPSAAQPDPAWEAKAKDLEDSGVLNAGDPGKWKGKEGSHIPKVTFAPGEAKVVTEHGMSEDHYITIHYIKNQDGVVIGLQEYKGTDAKAEAAFELPEGTTEITAYSHCNKHDHWAADAASNT